MVCIDLLPKIWPHSQFACLPIVELVEDASFQEVIRSHGIRAVLTRVSDVDRNDAVFEWDCVKEVCGALGRLRIKGMTNCRPWQLEDAFVPQYATSWGATPAVPIDRLLGGSTLRSLRGE